MNITVLGAGNMGFAITGYLSANSQHHVMLYTKKDLDCDTPLVLYDIENHSSCNTKNFEITSSKEEAIYNADLILCTYPAFLRKKFIQDIEPDLRMGAKLCFIPGYGGIEYSCKNLLQRRISIWGLQRVPYVARANCSESENSAYILSKKKMLYVASIPHKDVRQAAKILQGLFDIPCTSLNEYLAVTLAPSNPLLHITGLFNIFKNYRPGIIYDEPMHFYEQWNNEASEILLQYDDELQKICQNLKPLDLREVVSLKEYYDAFTPDKMTKKLQSIESFKAVMAPLQKREGGYIPDLQSRMFIEDYPYGVCVIKAFAQIAKVETPIIDMLLNFYKCLSGNIYFNKDGSLGKDACNTGIPFLYNINSIEDLTQFYHER